MIITNAHPQHLILTNAHPQHFITKLPGVATSAINTVLPVDYFTQNIEEI